MKCISKKVCYSSKGQAEEALIYTRSKYSSGSRSGSGPVAVYLCPDCNYYHMTSKGEKSDVLTSEEKNKIKLQQEAVYWNDKFKNI